MLLVLSPAKSLDLTPGPRVSVTQPALMDDTESLMKTTRNLSQKKIRELMSLSDALAKLNYDRFRSFELPFTEDNALPAAFAFDGEVYKGLDARSLRGEDLAWAQDHVAILSGLYGLLRPLDLMQAYRLEMGTKLSTRRGANLYAFWGDRITEELNARLASHEDRALVNLASNEYFKAVRPKRLEGDVITCVFEDLKPGQTRNVISFMAKHARGAMARWIIEQRVDRREGLKDFAEDRYRFQPELSTDDTLVFSRAFVPAGQKS
ncbi:MAG: peroxide stress protein YaaA [Sandaracinaceae bacterium]|nr:MAG: peroxide stress protein YaaA [Sandaracinaceae bacterium]